MSQPARVGLMCTPLISAHCQSSFCTLTASHPSISATSLGLVQQIWFISRAQILMPGLTSALGRLPGRLTHPVVRLSVRVTKRRACIDLTFCPVPSRPHPRPHPHTHPTNQPPPFTPRTS